MNYVRHGGGGGVKKFLLYSYRAWGSSIRGRTLPSSIELANTKTKYPSQIFKLIIWTT